MTKGKSKYYKWRIVKVDFTDEKGVKSIYYQLQSKMHGDFLGGYVAYGAFYSTVEECEKAMVDAIAYDNRPRVSATYTPID